MDILNFFKKFSRQILRFFCFVTNRFVEIPEPEFIGGYVTVFDETTANPNETQHVRRPRHVRDVLDFIRVF